MSDLGPEFRPPADAVPAVRELSERIVALARSVGRSCGYAIGEHGSLNRDVDLIAAPWTEEAVSAQELADALCAAVTAELGECYPGRPFAKPHGRLVWSMTFQGAVKTRNGAFPYIDLSILPRAPA